MKICDRDSGSTAVDRPVNDPDDVDFIVIDRSGQRHQLRGPAGWSVMEVIRDYGLAEPRLRIKAECGGCCACATCHVYAAPAGILPAVSETEDACLDQAFELRPESRLSCQLLLSEANHRSLTVTLTEGTEV